ncbi:MAG: vitamin B12 dependent-methionine synthase activation domain-containing protein [Paludibacter sp.]
MNTFSLQLSDLALNIDEIYLNLGYGGHTPDEQFIEMIDNQLENIAGFCAPRAGYRIVEGKTPNSNYLEIDNTAIKVGPVITKYLKNSTHFAIFVATAGVEFDDYLEQLKADGDIVSEFLAYSIGTEIAEATVRFITEKIAEEANEQGFNCTHSYSPGYCSWHVREQEQLFKLFPVKPCGVELNASNLMHPVKSVSGIIGLGKDVKLTPHACEICGMITCFKRKI